MKRLAFIFIIPLLFGLNMGALYAEDVLNLGQIVVTPTKTEKALGDVPIETSLITREEIEYSNVQTVADFLRYIPGLIIGVNKDSDRTWNLNWRATLKAQFSPLWEQPHIGSDKYHNQTYTR